MVKKTNKKTEELEGGGDYVVDMNQKKNFPGYEVYFDIESYLNQRDKIKLLFKHRNEYYEGTIQLIKTYTFKQKPIFEDIKPKYLIEFFEHINRKGIELPVTDPKNINQFVDLPKIIQNYNLYMSVDIDSMSTDGKNYNKNKKIHEDLNKPEIFSYSIYAWNIFYNKTKHGNKYIYFMNNVNLKIISDILKYLDENNIKDQIKLNVPQVQSPQQQQSPPLQQASQGGKNSQYIMTKQGKRKIHVGKRGGKYYIMNKKKVYVK